MNTLALVPDTEAQVPLQAPPSPRQTSQISPRRLRPVVVVSISLGPSERNSRVETTLLGRPVIAERIGTDGNQLKMRELFEALDGKVDAFGFGGANLGISVAGREYEFKSLEPLVAGLTTPVVDGHVLRKVVDRRCIQRAAPYLPAIESRRALVASAGDRYDLTLSLFDAGYSVLIGDLGFMLGVPLAMRSKRLLHLVSRLVMPIASRMPFETLYPDNRRPTSYLGLRRWFDWATVVCGDYVHLRPHLPERLDGKVLVTNSVTAEDRTLLRARGAVALVTSTPLLEGRNFGTNVIEAALTAFSGKGRRLTADELSDLVGEDGLPPTVEMLNP